MFLAILMLIVDSGDVRSSADPSPSPPMYAMSKKRTASESSTDEQRNEGSDCKLIQGSFS